MFNIRFRIRLLYKSHMSTIAKSHPPMETTYGCLFCIQAGATSREGDATVFNSTDDLLAHLAQHPQPLPRVPGVTVLYGEISKANPKIEDFDIHLLNYPIPSPVPADVGKYAVATALKDHIHRGKDLPRPLAYDGELLEFYSGARVVGLTFPELWEGKWCIGWHNGQSGVFATKLIEIDLPRQSEIPMDSTSGMSVKTKWAWKPKTKTNGNEPSPMWLEFEKGETISNVQCKSSP